MDYRKLDALLGYHFTDRALLRRALTHPSYAAEHIRVNATNQRLEFLGDAVLQMSISNDLYRKHPKRQEGELSKIRSAVTNANALVSMATELKLGQFLRLGKGEQASGGRNRDSNLADALEAVIAAIYLDGGFDVADAFVLRIAKPFLEQPECLLQTENPKGALQELTQKLCQMAPEYEVVNVSGPDHLPEFQVHVRLDNKVLGVATGTNRKVAEKAAARLALAKLQEPGKPEST